MENKAHALATGLFVLLLGAALVVIVLWFRGDRGVRFEAIGRVILACQQAGIQKVGFLTEPRNEE